MPPEATIHEAHDVLDALRRAEARLNAVGPDVGASVDTS